MSTLTVVMPVYNEVSVIRTVVAGVVESVLDAVEGSCLVLVDDRGTDGTGAVLDELAAADDRITVLRQPENRGHGPAVRAGLDAAVGAGSAWVLLLDSDGQHDAGDFAGFWSRRADADLIVGRRIERNDPRHRRVLSASANLLVSVCAGRRVIDGNTGFKLVRGSLWRHLGPVIDERSFAPSLLLVMLAIRSGARVESVPVRHFARPGSPSSLRSGRLARAMVDSAQELLVHRRRAVAPFPG